MLKKIDWYIIRKFIGSYFFALLLIVCIFIIFDISERIDDFVTEKAPLGKIIFNYYLMFIPFFLNTFSPLFVFITVIFFTSKMAYNTEIIAILSSGISFMRMMLPYFLASSFIFLFTLCLNHFIIPPANKVRIEFESKYLKKSFSRSGKNMHLQISPNVYMYMADFYSNANRARYFSLEKYDNNQLLSKIMADNATYDSEKHVWTLRNYFIRHISDSLETIVKGVEKDTVINFSAEELRRKDNFIISMNYFELQENIKELKMRGQNPNKAILESYNRTSIPFSVFVLTLLGVSLSSRKVRGGIGMQIGLGIGISFAYILMLRFSEVFMQVGVANPLLAAWIPNILFLVVAVFLYIKAPK